MVSVENYRNMVLGQRFSSGKASITDVELSPRKSIDRALSKISRNNSVNSIESFESNKNTYVYQKPTLFIYN